VTLFYLSRLSHSQDILSQLCRKRRKCDKIKCSENNTTGKRVNVIENGKENLGGEKMVMSAEMESRYRKCHCCFVMILN
jgi:hypothetical protein